MISKKKYKSLLDDICQDCCSGDKWCILKEFLVEGARINPRLLMQIKCIEKFKFEEGCKLDKELDWDEGARLWVDFGLAARFNKIYNEEIKFKELYKQIMCY